MRQNLTTPSDGSDLTAEELEQMNRVRRGRLIEEVDGFRISAEMAIAALTKMGMRASGDFKPIATPWKGLNTTLGGGLWPGLHVVTGPTGAGKTQFALQLALRAAFDQVPVLYVALELGKDEILARLFALMMADANPTAPATMWSDLYHPKNGKESIRLLKHVDDAYRPALQGLRFHVEEGLGGEWSASTLESRAEGLGYRYGTRAGATTYPKWPLIVLDYLQIVGPEPERREDLRERIRTASMRARNVARQGATVVLLSSVSRENVKLLVPSQATEEEPLGTGDPSRLVGLGKESGEIEFSADTVLALGREEWAAAGNSTAFHLAVAKVRAGRPAWLRLAFNGTSFQESVSAAAVERIR